MLFPPRFNILRRGSKRNRYSAEDWERVEVNRSTYLANFLVPLLRSNADLDSLLHETCRGDDRIDRPRGRLKSVDCVLHLGGYMGAATLRDK